MPTGRAPARSTARPPSRRPAAGSCRAHCRQQRRVGEAGEDLAEGLAFVEDERGDVHQADRVVDRRARDGDHGAAVGVPDQQHRPVDLVHEARDVLRVAREPAQRVRRREHRQAAGLQLLDDRRPERGIGEAAVHEHDGGGFVFVMDRSYAAAPVRRVRDTTEPFRRWLTYVVVSSTRGAASLTSALRYCPLRLLLGRCRARRWRRAAATLFDADRRRRRLDLAGWHGLRRHVHQSTASPASHASVWRTMRTPSAPEIRDIDVTLAAFFSRSAW